MRTPVLLLLAAVVLQPASSQSLADATKITRAVAILNGVFSPRGFFNITVRLYQLPSIDAAKFDLKKSRITLDFKPGATTTEKEIQQVMVEAGYKPGPVRIEVLPAEQASETGPGWVKLKHPKSKNPVIRWVQLNF